jgi:pimeloyl-ACP methyl ester carboxylesterase
VKALAVSGYLLCGFKWFARVHPEMMQYRIERQLPRVQAATVVIYGRDDRNCPEPWAETVAKLLPAPQPGKSLMAIS